MNEDFKFLSIIVMIELIIISLIVLALEIA